ncbi:ABC transporter substrate-binding protein [Pseudonocardia sp. HH130630-07]|nr:ABC transporter substrate-binding protein [Pseudonocardia sp. HH130630-07]
MLRGIAAAVPLLALGPALTACAPAADRPPTRLLRVSQASDPRSMDPHKVADIVSMNALINVFDCLTERTADNRLGPRLATSWTAVTDTRWRFTLRRGVRFHNGEVFDARAVAFSIERLLDPATASPIVELRYVTGVEIVDDHTVDIVTDRPDPVLPAKLSLFGGVVVPPGYLREVGEEGFAAAPVGTGPFRFTEWQRSVALRLTAVPDHWAGPPGVERLELQTISNPASALAALQSDAVDMVTGLNPDAALQLQGYRGIAVANSPGIRMSYLSLDTTDPVLSDVRVRRALNHAVDVPLLIDAVLDGKAREVPTMIPRESFGFDPAVAPYSRDLERARALLAEAGHPDGFSTTLTASSADAMVAQAVAGLLARAGVRAEVELLDPSTYSSRLTSDNRGALGPVYLAATTGWTLDGQSPVQSNVRSDRRQSRWTDPRADALIDREELSIDPAARTAAFAELQELLSDEAPFVFLHQLDAVLITNERVSWTPNVVGVLAMATAEVRDG